MYIHKCKYHTPPHQEVDSLYTIARLHDVRGRYRESAAGVRALLHLIRNNEAKVQEVRSDAIPTPSST